MILTSHAIIGAAVSRLAPADPILGFLLAVASHFVADTVPHWDYSHVFRSAVRDERGQIMNMHWNKDFLFDFFKIGADAAAGALLALFIFQAHSGSDFIALFAGICGGVFQDGLQILYLKIKKEPFIAIQGFHEKIHARPMNNLWGITLQAAVVAAAVFVSTLLRP